MEGGREETLGGMALHFRYHGRLEDGTDKGRPGPSRLRSPE